MKLIAKKKTIFEIDHRATGKVARDERKKNKVSLRSVAKMMSVSAAYLSDLELGRRAWSNTLVIRFQEAIQRCWMRRELTIK